MAQQIDVLTLTVTEAFRRLSEGTLTSVSLVQAYLSQINQHNRSGLNLHALISTAPTSTLLATAARLDSERQAGRVRGILHGIPFVVKDVFFTPPEWGMPTTAGAACFLDAKVKPGLMADVVRRLVEDEGMILIGKANLTEFCGLKGKGLTPGWSSAGGQTQSPYIFGGLENDGTVIGHSAPGGSSSGSAVSVAAGFAPLSIGTECVGSVMLPASRAGLFALKCGLGEVEDGGMFKYTEDCIDFIGGMAKSVNDLGVLLSGMMTRGIRYGMGHGFRGMRVGFVEVDTWRLPDEVCAWPGDTRAQVERGYTSALGRMGALGAKVRQVKVPDSEDISSYHGKSMFFEIAMYQLQTKTMQAFLDGFADSEVRTLADMIAYNEAHREQCLPPSHPNQDELEGLVKIQRDAGVTEEMMKELRRRGTASLDRMLEGCDVLVALSESYLVRYTSAAGYPVGCLPLGAVKYSERNERPYGMCVAAGKGQEMMILRFMAACENGDSIDSSDSRGADAGEGGYTAQARVPRTV